MLVNAEGLAGGPMPGAPGSIAVDGLVEHLPIGVFTARNHGNGTVSFDYMSHQAGRMLGVDPARAVEDAQVVLALVDPEDAAELANRFRDLFGRPGPFRWVGHVTVEGRPRVVRVVCGDGIPDGAGIVAHGYFEDITERHGEFDAVRNALEGLEEAQRLSRTGTFVFDPAAGTATWSGELYRIYGRSPDLPAPTFAELDALIPGGSAAFEQAATGAAVRAEPGAGFEHGINMPDGSTRWVLTRGRYERDAHGNVVRIHGTETDITDLHEAREAQRASDELAMAIIQGTADVIYVKDPAGRILLMNEVGARALGRTPESVIGLDEHTWFPTAQASAIVETDLAVLRGGSRVTLEEQVTDADGEVRTFLSSKSPLLASDGRVIGLLAIARDISKRKQVEEALRASEQRYADLVNSVPVGIFSARTSPDGVLTLDFLSPTAARILGRPADASVDWQPFSAIHPADLGEAYRLLTSQYADQQPIVWEGRVLAAGATRHVRIEASAGEFDGEDLRTQGYVLDITAQRLADEQVRASAALRESVFDALEDGLLVFDGNGTVVAANPRAGSLFSSTVMETPGGSYHHELWEQRWEDGTRLAPEDSPVAVTLRSGEPVRDAVIELIRPDGAHKWHRVNTVALRDGSGGITGVVASVRDITDQRELEARLRQSQRLEAVGQLAGGVAHDFNNLLAAVRGYTELVREELPAGSQARVDLAEALRAADRAAGLTRQLLAFSRRATLHQEVVNAADVVEQLVPMLRRLVGEHIEIGMVPDPGLGHVRVDIGQLEQIVVNLAVNARDAMPQGGRLSIRLANATCGLDPDLDPDAALRPGAPLRACVRLTVADTGTGMDAATISRIFEPFFTTKEVGKGSGMGLATVYGIVGAFGGRIAVQSAPGAGTTFTIDLPRVDPAAVTAIDPPAGTGAPAAGGVEPEAGHHRTVLLVEDEPAVRDVTARMLRGMGYAVIDASGPREALALDDDTIEAIDVVVTDVVMPRMNGPQMADLLDARRHRPLPTVLMSGYAPEPALAERLARAGTAFIGKPFTRDALRAAITDAVEMRGAVE